MITHLPEAQDFLRQTMPRLVVAERALQDGDVGPRRAMWSSNDPVTLFGADMSAAGWSAIGGVFDLLGQWFSDCTAYEIELVAADASGDLAYTVAYEHISSSHRGAPRSVVLRVTHVYRREDGEWKVVHRHGETLADGVDHLPGTTYS